MSETNAWLADQLGNGDEHAFSKLVGRHHALVFGLCLKLLGHRQDAEDATQETFGRFARYLDRWDRERPIEPYLATIAGNRCRTLLARKRSYRSLSVAEEPTSTIAEQQRDADSLAEELQLAMESLPDDQRRAFEMFHNQSLGYGEIAERLERPIGTVKSWVHRARRQVIESLQQRDVVVAVPARRRIDEGVDPATVKTGARETGVIARKGHMP